MVWSGTRGKEMEDETEKGGGGIERGGRGEIGVERGS